MKPSACAKLWCATPQVVCLLGLLRLRVGDHREVVAEDEFTTKPSGHEKQSHADRVQRNNRRPTVTVRSSTIEHEHYRNRKQRHDEEVERHVRCRDADSVALSRHRHVVAEAR